VGDGLDSLKRFIAIRGGGSRWRLAGYLTIAAGFLISRVLFADCGFRFDNGELMWHTLDFALLRTHLTQSIFYLHCQPPLLNLFLGLVLKVTRNRIEAKLVLQSCLGLAGLSLLLIMFQLMVDLGVPMAIALVLTLLFQFNPGTLLLENWFYTPCPTQLLLCAAALSLYRFLNQSNRRYGVAFLACAGIPIFLNSSFQPIWFVVVIALAYFCFRQQILRLLVPIAVIAGLIAILLIKNELTFGLLTTSSWFGMNLSRMTTFELPDSKRKEEISAGQLSEFAAILPFSGLNKYPMEAAKPTGIPVLDLQRKANGQFNLNNIIYIDICRHYLADARRTLMRHPEVYFHTIVKAIGCYLGTVKDQDYNWRRTPQVETWNSVYDEIFQPSDAWWWPRDDNRCEMISSTLMIALPAIVLLAFIRLVCTAVWKPVDLTLAFILVTIAYTTATAVMFEIGENPRFRSVVDPLFLILLGILMGDLYRFLGVVGRRLTKAVHARHAEMGSS
jgi:hypothetical protein